MKRVATIVAVLLLAGFAAISLWKDENKNAAPETQEGSGVSEERKAEVRRFWDLQRQATGFRLEGKWEEAKKAYAEALSIDPEHEDALYYSGNVFFELDEYDNAIDAWRRLEKVNTLSARVHFQLGSVYSCGLPGAPLDLDVAVREFKRALAINQEETGPILRLGEVYLLRGETEEALAFLTKAIQTNPGSVEAHYMIGFLRWREGDPDEALSSLQQAVTNSRIKRPAAMPLGEGDTKTGSGPMLAEGAGRKSLLAPNWMALGKWADDVSVGQMEAEYTEIHNRLKLLVVTNPAK